VLDNCDAMMTLSQCIDEEASPDKDNPEYYNEYAYMHFENKRGTGKVSRSILRFTAKDLMLENTDEDPSLYEVKLKGKSNFAL